MGALLAGTPHRVSDNPGQSSLGRRNISISDDLREE
jgi:hypothetical protein